MKNTLKIAVLVGFAAIVTGCAAGGGSYGPSDQAGFFSGIWHGWIAPLALIAHIFDGDIRIYETDNDGIWYDVGFYIAVISGFGSLSLRRRPKSKKEQG
jgi:hypothetical protein